MAIVHDNIRVPVDGAGKRVDNADITNGGDQVYRQVGSIGSPDQAGLEAIAEVKSALPSKTQYGLVVRQAPIQLSELAVLADLNGDNFVIPAPGAGSHIVIWKFWFQTADDITIDMKAGPTSLAGGPVLYAQGGSQDWAFDHVPLFTCSDNQAFNLWLDRANVNVCGRIYYTVETP